MYIVLKVKCAVDYLSHPSLVYLSIPVWVLIRPYYKRGTHNYTTGKPKKGVFDVGDG